jgi:hypothetical protein
MAGAPTRTPSRVVCPGARFRLSTAAFASGATIAVGPQPQGIALTPDGTRAYVANRVSDTVSDGAPWASWRQA